MPPRLGLWRLLQPGYGQAHHPRPPHSTPLRPSTSTSTSPFSTTPSRLLKKRSRSTSHAARIAADPYLRAHSKLNRAATAARLADSKARLEAHLGSPIHGLPKPTPFVRSLADPIPASLDRTLIPPTPNKPSPPPNSSSSFSYSTTTHEPGPYLNHFLHPTEVKRSLSRSTHLTRPLQAPSGPDSDPNSTPQDEAELSSHASSDAKARLAIQRILSLDKASREDIGRVNVQRCIEAFGRHRTDDLFTSPTNESSPPQKRVNQVVTEWDEKRVGPDTGSSEVQIAILTAKIKTISDHLEAGHKGDTQVRRRLRLAVHKRQKLMRYFQRQDRGGKRWQYLTKMLGLTDGCWKGEITV